MAKQSTYSLEVYLLEKVAIVTGGGNGIGRSCCIKLAESGIRVIVADIDILAAKQTINIVESRGGKGRAFHVNLAEVSEIRDMVAFAIHEFGGIHILVNNAGLLHTTNIEDITEIEWDKICNVNLRAVFFACQSVVPYFKKNMYGKIVNISSLAGRNGGVANGVAYSATKAGVIGLSRSLATRLAKFNINVNTVCPGTTNTNIIHEISAEKLSELISRIPLGRLGEVDDTANIVRFLCSDEASFITGATIDVNGGMFIG